MQLALRLQGSLGQSNHSSTTKVQRNKVEKGLLWNFAARICFLEYALPRTLCIFPNVSVATCAKCSNAGSFPSNGFNSHSGSCLSSQLLVVVAVKSNGVSHTHCKSCGCQLRQNLSFPHFASFAFGCVERQSVINFDTFLLGSQKRETEGRIPEAQFSWSSMMFEAVSPPPAFIALLQYSQLTF